MRRSIQLAGLCFLIVLYVIFSGVVSEKHHFGEQNLPAVTESFRSGLNQLTDIEESALYLKDSIGKLQFLFDNVRKYALNGLKTQFWTEQLEGLKKIFDGE